MKKIEADQDLPYKLMKNKLLHRDQYKELLYIVNKNIPNISSIEIIEMFKKLSNTGCSCAMFANSLVEQIYENEEEFQEIFGFSLLTKNKDKIDCNKLMVDIFSKLYKAMRFKFIEYERYEFNSVREAALNLIGKNYQQEIEASSALFENGYMSDGVSQNGNLLFKKINPKITNMVGTCEEVAKEKFGIDGIKNLDELKKICSSKNITLEFKDTEIYQKLTGLGAQNFNFWSNYYLSQYNINYNLNSESIIVSDFNNDYNTFMQHINQLVQSGYSVTVASLPNSIAYMHTDKKLSWSKISSESAGHVMLFKGFNIDNDILVSSYGEDYIIPKEYFNILEFKKIQKLEKTKELEEQKSR